MNNNKTQKVEKLITAYTDPQSYSCRADKNPYRNDGRADKDTYRHDGRAYSLSQTGNHFCFLFDVELHGKVGSQLLPLFENMGNTFSIFSYSLDLSELFKKRF